MKFHWGDLLHREGGHWNMTPNAERGKYYAKDCASLSAETEIVTVTKESENLAALGKLPNLQELTLHEVKQEHIDVLAQIGQITRLRITHARPMTLAVLTGLAHVEELVLEYVSGFDDLSPVAEMTRLRALYIENLRRVRDFSPLGGCTKLRTLEISGTFDWRQEMTSVAFAADLQNLEYLGLMVRLEDPESAKALVAIGDHCAFGFPDNLLPLETFAYLEAHCERASFKPVQYAYVGPSVDLPDDDPRASLSDDEIRASHDDILVCTDGRRLLFRPGQYDHYQLLGKGARNISVKTKNAAEKAAAHEQSYRDLVEAARRDPPLPG